MSVSQTSLEAWCRLQDEGRVCPNQLIILDVFKAANKMFLSNMDVSNMLGWPINRVTPRVNELIKKGKLVKVATKVQLQTGRTVQVYCLVEDAHLFFSGVVPDNSPLLFSDDTRVYNNKV